MQPSRGRATKKILRAAVTIKDPRQRRDASHQPPLNVAFALAEVVWIVTGRNDLAFLKALNLKLPEYVGDGAYLRGAYGYRLRRHNGVDQITRACEEKIFRTRGKQCCNSGTLPLTFHNPT
ncbi:MAG: hypothetical protein OXC83_00940 [Chloroflexi bacterium]|nr:hypothetical protein [Chloroflexota bacterium]